MQAQGRYQHQDDRPAEDHIVRLSGVSWEDYERLLAMRGDHSAPRFIESPTTFDAIRGYRQASRNPQD